MSSRSTKRPVTMNDVAQLAGVSRTTVSFVLNEVPNSNIPPETQERVWEAIRELNYRPNALARGLRAQRTQTIGFISDEVASTPFAGQMIAAAQATAWAHGKLLLLVNTGRNRDVTEAAVETLLERQVEAIIYATMYHRAVNPPAALHEVPTVLVDCFAADGSLPSVVPDEVQGGRSAVEHLLERGHRRIAFINDVENVPAAAGRLEGYREALALYGVPFDERFVLEEQSDPAGGYRAAYELLQQTERPTALFCFNDRMAMGAYDAIRKLDLSIPDEVAVVGFDNQEVISAHLYPPLTTVQLPHQQMGEWAVNFLLGQLDGPPPERNVQQRLACPLVPRASS